MTGGAVQIRPLFSAEQVNERIDALADEIRADYGDGLPLCLAIAEGALRFTEELGNALAARGARPAVQVIRARRTEATELVSLQIEAPDLGGLAGRDVLVLDDIADEGRTLEAVLDLLEEADCRSVKVAVLVSKLERRAASLALDYVGFEVASGWVVGFGMDLDGELRDLDEIGVVQGTETH
jgi:hypoxanthine phosphoribosyltransferase